MDDLLYSTKTLLALISRFDTDWRKLFFAAGTRVGTTFNESELTVHMEGMQLIDTKRSSTDSLTRNLFDTYRGVLGIALWTCSNPNMFSRNVLLTAAMLIASLVNFVGDPRDVSQLLVDVFFFEPSAFFDLSYITSLVCDTFKFFDSKTNAELLRDLSRTGWQGLDPTVLPIVRGITSSVSLEAVMTPLKQDVQIRDECKGYESIFRDPVFDV
jgi:hypothetical protein